MLVRRPRRPPDNLLPGPASLPLSLSLALFLSSCDTRNNVGQLARVP